MITLLQVFVKRNSVYVATIIVGAFVGERVSGSNAAGCVLCWPANCFMLLCTVAVLLYYIR